LLTSCKYRPPEWVQDKPGQPPGDIFSLGCTFLDVHTVLMGRRMHDFGYHRAQLIEKSAFRDTLDKCVSWLQILETDAPSDKDFIKTLSSMIEREEGRRPTAKLVREFMKTSITADKFHRCGSFCSERHDTGTTTEFGWGFLPRMFSSFSRTGV